MPVSYRLGAFYFLFFVGAGLWVAYLPPYFAARGLGAAEIAWLLALPQLARIVAPTAWGALADRFGAQRAIVVLGCGAGVVCYSLLPVVSGFAAFAWLMGLTSLVATAALPLVEAITLGVLAGQTGRYGPIRLWGSIGFMLAVFAGGLWLDFRSVHALPYAMLAFVIPALAVGLTLPTPGCTQLLRGRWSSIAPQSCCSRPRSSWPSPTARSTPSSRCTCSALATKDR